MNLILTFFLLSSSPIWAWNDTGHRLVALVAWDRLSVSGQERIVTHLRAHPRFAEDFRMPEEVARADESSRARWIFAHAAVWPDIVKGFEGELRQTWNNSSWHYINLPYYLTDADRKELDPDLPTNLERVWDPNVHGAGRLNVIQSIARSRHVLTEGDTSSSDRGLAISWLLHTVGDLHQPLHSTALFTSRRFRRGDAGGNGIMVVGAEDLHAVWDDLIPDVGTLAEHDALVYRLTSDEGVTRQATTGATMLDTEDWLSESHDLAIEVAYNDLVLDTVAANEAVYDPSKSWRDQPYLPEVQFSDRYLARARRVAVRRIVLAGHRLAAVLKECGF